MTMSPNHRRGLAEGMRRSADERMCPLCNRRAAIVWRQRKDAEFGRQVPVCRWALQGKCEDPMTELVA